MILYFESALSVLSKWSQTLLWGKDSTPTNALAWDAVRGSMMEDRHRDSMDFYPMARMPWAINRAITRLRALPYYVNTIKTTSPLPVPERCIGWGTYKWDRDPHIAAVAANTEETALIDTAEGYGWGKVEEALGAALSGCPVWPIIATKVSRNHMRRDSVINAARRSAQRLRMTPIDLYQIHWPVLDVPLEETMGAMSDLLNKGEIRHIGVSNFSVDQLITAQLLDPRVSTIQVRATETQQLETVLLPYCREAGIKVIGHSPFGQRPHPHAPGQLRKLLDLGIIPIPGTSSPIHLAENLACARS